MGKEYLGRGWAFPIELDLEGKLGYAENEDKIQQSIMIILGTRQGSRVMRPTFGSKLHELAFEQTNSLTKSQIANYVTEALVAWEARIEVLAVEVNENDSLSGILSVNIEYKVRATNSIFNMVYPFYLKEGVGNAGT